MTQFYDKDSRPTSSDLGTDRRIGTRGRRATDQLLDPQADGQETLTVAAIKLPDSLEQPSATALMGILPSQMAPHDSAVWNASDTLSPAYSRPTVSLVVPAMNEAENIPWVFGRIPELIDEVILVDGYSKDDTVAAALRLRPDTRVLRQHARGKGSALRTGFAAATCDYIVMIDADGSMDPAEIEFFVRALDNGYDFVKGSRYLPGGGSDDLTRLRNLGNYALKTSVNMMFMVPFTDLCYGFVAFRRTCLKPLGLTSHGFEIETEMAIRAVKASLKIAEVPSNESMRRSGASNLNTFRDGKRVLRTLVRERVSRRKRPVVDWLQFPEPHMATVSSLHAPRATAAVDVTTINHEGENRTIVTVVSEQDGQHGILLGPGDTGEQSG